MGGEKRVTVITPCARRGAKTAGFNQLRRVCSCKRACVCVTERESGVSGDGDVAGNASATVARPRQPQPPLHRPRLSPPPDSPSISLSPCSSPPPPFSTLGPPSVLHPPPRGDKDKKATASSFSVTLERGDACVAVCAVWAVPNFELLRKFLPTNGYYREWSLFTASPEGARTLFLSGARGSFKGKLV